MYDPTRSQWTTCDDACGDGPWVALPEWNWRPLESGKALAYASGPLAENLVMAGSGSVDLWLQSTAPDVDVQVTLTDRGQGIPDIELAMQAGWSTATEAMRQRGFGAGLGLPNIKKNTDEFAIESTVGVGTTLRYSVHLN